MKPSTIALSIAAILLAQGCADGGARRPGALPPYAAAARITDEAIRADFASIEALQQRLALVNADGRVPTSNYHWAKAQCWLDMARHNYHENDRSGAVEAALAQSDELLKALEAKGEPGDATPLIPQSVRIRDDLWDKAGLFKRSPQFACAAARVACYEVQLVWMGHEYSEGGWRHANPYIGIAEQMASQIERDLAACVRPSPAPVSAPVPAPAPVMVPVLERVVLSADALFAFGRNGRDDIQPEGRAKLDALAARAKQLARIDRITLTGYTDRLGSREYNARLSRARAETVKTYLVGLGVPETSIQFEGRGSANPVVLCEAQSRTALSACLQPNRRVEIDLAGAVMR